MQPTPEQRQVIETLDRALAVEAGAGTGKTRVLVERFIHLLEQHPDWELESIIAITFTRKAAREMRTRVRQAIQAKAEMHPGDLAWQERLRSLDQLQISTIHGLCSRILRENAIEVGIDPQFIVLDEQDADLLKEEAVRQTLVKLVDEDDPGLELLESHQVGELQTVMEDMLARRGLVYHLYQDLPGEEQLLQGWSTGLELMRSEMWAEMQSRYPRLDQVMQEVLDTTIYSDEDLLTPYVLAAKEGCSKVNEGNLIAGIEAWSSILLNRGRAINWGSKDSFTELKENMTHLKSIGKELVEKGFCAQVDETDRVAAGELQHWRRIWARLNQTYDDLKNESSFLDFDDLELRTWSLLDNPPYGHRLVEFIDQINHLMVDEFQDTNRLQQKIVYALAPPEAGAKLFVVGDAKQSIYRFRQAQVSVFNQTIKDIQTHTGGTSQELSVSFRSHEVLITALNHLFNAIFKPIGADYKDFEAKPGPLSAHRKTPPKVEGVPAPVEILLLPSTFADGTKILAEGARIWEARWLATRLHDLHASGFMVYDHTLGGYVPFEYRHAAILFRATTQFPLYEDEFKSFGLPYRTVSGRGYYDRPEIQDLLALLACIDNPLDDLNLAAVLRSPLFSLSDETLYFLRWYGGDNQRSEEVIHLAHALQNPPDCTQLEQIRFAASVLKHLWEMKGMQEVSILLQEAIDLTSYNATLALLDGEHGRQLSNIKKFMQFTLQHEGVSLSRFLRMVQDLRAREAREGEAIGSAPESGAVQLMSVHAAKGLEFPVVGVADMGRKRSLRDTSSLLQDPEFGLAAKIRDEKGNWLEPGGYSYAKWLETQMELAENKRLLYVALTRASDLLLLTGQLRGSDSWMTDLLSSWEITPESEEDALITRQDYSLRLFAPLEVIEPAVVPISSPVETLALHEIPQMAQAKQVESHFRPLSTTSYLRLVEDSDLDQNLPYFSRADPFSPVSAGDPIIGRIVHHALAEWDCLQLPAVELAKRLANWTRQSGIIGDPHLDEVVQQAARLLIRLKDSDIYDEVNQSVFKQHELPFNFTTDGRTFYGMIDLVYQDQGQEWHILDWKTEWLRRTERQAKLENYQKQITVYAQAAHSTLGVFPNAAICTLRPDIEIIRLNWDELEEVWNKIASSDISTVLGSFGS